MMEAHFSHTFAEDTCKGATLPDTICQNSRTALPVHCLKWLIYLHTIFNTCFRHTAPSCFGKVVASNIKYDFFIFRLIFRLYDHSLQMRHISWNGVERVGLEVMKDTSALLMLVVVLRCEKERIGWNLSSLNICFRWID